MSVGTEEVANLSYCEFLDRMRPLRTPLLRVPDAGPLLFALLRTAPPDHRTVANMITHNRTLYDRAHALGGTVYPGRRDPFMRRIEITTKTFEAWYQWRTSL